MSEALLSLGDIARLAKVARPVVSTWRRRPRSRAGVVPFPEPAVTEPAERFRALEVVDWLERTGRGNTAEAAVELALVTIAGSRGPVVQGRQIVLEALVTLRGLAGGPLGDLSRDDVVDLADEHDPDDVALFSEISGAGADLMDAVAEADDLCEAAFGAAEALDRLRHHSALELTAQGVDLIRALVWGLSGQGGGPLVLAGLESSPQMAADLLASVPEGSEVLALHSDPSARWLTRNLLTRQIPHSTKGLDRVIRVLATDGLSHVELLDRVDELQLELRPGDFGVVIGAAATLIDRLPSATLATHRDGLLRLGALRHAVRLPAGLNTKAPRQALAVWVLAPNTQPIPPGQRWLLTSDLSGGTLDDAVISHLVGDIVAGLGSPRETATHAFAAAQVVSLPSLIAGRGPLVAPGTRPQRLADIAPGGGRAEQVLKARTVLAQLTEERPSRFTDIHVGLPRAAESRRRIPGEPVTIETLLHTGTVKVIPGTRVDLDRLGDGSLPVITSDDVTARIGTAARATVSVDPIDLTRLYPRARRVEEGDIVFVTSPRPAAVVCREPGAVVGFPARVLRVLGSELVPEMVAALINALPETDKRWRGWAFPRADHTAYDHLTTLLRAIEDERADLATRHTQLDQLAHLLTGGPARGTLTLTTSTTEGDH